MKIRSDFVTNSSSSSFIFKEFDRKQIKKAVDDRLSVPPHDEWEAMLYEWSKRSLKNIERKRFDEYPFYDLVEVYDWYHNNVLSEIFGVPYYEALDEHSSWNAKLQEAILEKPCTHKMFKRLAAMLIMDIYGNCFDEADRFSHEIKPVLISMAFMSSYIWEYMTCRNIRCNALQEFYLDNTERLLDTLAEFDGSSIGEAMECIFDAKYLYFDEEETNYLMCEAIGGTENCLYYCGHMG